MSIDIATRLGTTLIGAVTQPVESQPRSSVLRSVGAMLFNAPARIGSYLARRRAERDALVSFAMAEGKGPGGAGSEVDRAVLLSGRADMLFPSYFVNAHQR